MQGFRFEPTTAAADRVVLRPRLTTVLAGRFEHRLTTVVGAAGFGKTTALALAVENNRLDPVGCDVWLGASPDDNAPVHLLSGLARALDVEPAADVALARTQIFDAIWASAPHEVAIIIDDAHLISSEDSRATLVMLLTDMPANGHLVLAARTNPNVPMARLAALGQVLRVRESDLALDDDEVSDLHKQRAATGAPQHAADVATNDLPRHAATADLQLAAGSHASIDFLWEEILSGIAEDRLTQLKRCSVIDELDDEIVDELTDHQFDAATLVMGVPLVEMHEDGARRLHALLREALIGRLTPAERLKALSVAADVERARGRHDVAVRLYAEAGDQIAVRDTAREFVLLPILKQPVEAVASIRTAMLAVESESAVTAALRATALYVRSEADSEQDFERCAELAGAAGDDEVEAFALHRLFQISLMHVADTPTRILDRLTVLAETDSRAKGLAAHAHSILAQHRGDVRTAMALLDQLDQLDPATQVVIRAERLCDLGRPEIVGVGLTPDDLATLPPGAEIYISYAMWLRGEALPELADVIVTDMIPTVLRRGYNQASASILCVGTSIALAAGHVAAARRRADHAAEIAANGLPDTGLLFARVASASVASTVGSDAAAAAILAPEAGSLAIADWPYRAHFLAIPLVYLTRPEFRPVLDRCDFGPSISMAVAAGQSLVAVRAATSPAENVAAMAMAARLPWNNPQLLRVHVLPHHLAELACAAAAHGNSASVEVLESLPDVPGLLTRVAQDSGAAVAALAVARLGELPTEPTHQLTTTTLGTVTLRRDGEIVTVPDWVRRRRVRELWALLLERRRLHRYDVLEMMWPSHDDERKASTNLRSTLSTLQHVLEPDRPDDAEPYFLRIENDHLSVHPGLHSDADMFDELVAAAQADDNAGLPGHALEGYRRAVALYEGDYLDDIDASWAVLSRLRLRSLAVSATCRIAELTAAKGEPEEAARIARRAQMIDEHSERAGRLLVSALDASGDRPAARRAATHLEAMMRANGIDPSPETVRLFRRIVG